MYTVDDSKENIYEDEEFENENWNNNKGIVFKVIIIILCIIVLIWLIMSLKSNRNTQDNGSVHIANTEKIRLASEEYFFLKNNKSKTRSISLAGLKKEALIGDIVDANNKVCSDSGTFVNLDDDVNAYKMTINFSCSTNDKMETFYYSNSNLACLNCNGSNTHMDGKTVIDDDTDDKKTKPDDIVPDEESDSEPEYSCIHWSEWSKDRVNDSTLLEKTKILVTGVKYGKKTTYGEWSDYTKTPIINNTGIEIETKVVTEEVWGDYKSSRSIDTNNPNIKIISTEVVNGGNSCRNGFVYNNSCYSNEVKYGNLTYKEYNSGMYHVQKEYCEGARNLPDKDGKYVATYINCIYNEKIGSASKSSAYTIYTYQEKEVKDVTYYRYRTINEVNEPDSYTKTKYEEEDLPDGYVKLDGSEETYYSYRLITCEK